MLLFIETELIVKKTSMKQKNFPLSYSNREKYNETTAEQYVDCSLPTLIKNSNRQHV